MGKAGTCSCVKLKYALQNLQKGGMSSFHTASLSRSDLKLAVWVRRTTVLERTRLPISRTYYTNALGCRCYESIPLDEGDSSIFFDVRSKPVIKYLVWQLRLPPQCESPPPFSTIKAVQFRISAGA